MDLRREEVVTFSDAERGIVIAKDGVGLLGEPGFVTKFEGDWRGAFCLECRGREEVFEAIRICFEIRRKLEEEQTEFARLARWFQGSNELSNVGATVLQSLEVRDALGRFEAEAEVFGVAANQPSSIFAVGRARKV